MQKKTVVLGLGVSGRAAAEFLLRENVCVVGVDGKSATLQSAEIACLQELGLLVQGELEPIDWNLVDRLIVSPGISPKNAIYKTARQKGITIVGEAELALSHLKKKLLAVTGTNGKTTVVLLVQHILRGCGIRAKAVGNVGSALCNELIFPGDEEVLIVELSSYQLETMKTKVFDAGVLLNITPDHLDRYENMQEYAAAKCRLENVIKEDCPFFVHSQVVAEYGSLLTKPILFDQAMAGVLPEEYRDKGGHDCENALAAWALCQRFSFSQEAFSNALLTFTKPPHRIEFVREVQGVCFYDDSKGTNIDAVIRAVKAMKGPVILIAGGVDKGSSYLQWKDCFLNKVKQIIAIGEAAPKIERELHPYFNLKRADTLSSAVELAVNSAERGDVVLLSPGCSSFDMFTDYAHRGNEFRRFVESLI